MSPDYRREGTSLEQIDRGRVEHTLVGVAPPHDRPSMSFDDAGKAASFASNAGNAGKIIVGTIVGALMVVAGAAVWASQRPSVQYVDERDRLNAAAAVSVDSLHDRRLEQIDVRLERLVTIAEQHEKRLDGHEARIRDNEAGRTPVLTARSGR